MEGEVGPGVAETVAFSLRAPLGLDVGAWVSPPSTPQRLEQFRPGLSWSKPL